MSLTSSGTVELTLNMSERPRTRCLTSSHTVKLNPKSSEGPEQ